jgi:hypothetical protein
MVDEIRSSYQESDCNRELLKKKGQDVYYNKKLEETPGKE